MPRVNYKPLSVNDAWAGRRFKTPEYTQYCKDMAFLLPKIALPAPPYELRLKFGFSSKASDIDNCIKPLQDQLASKYKFNDKLIYKLVVEREITPKGKEFIEFDIQTYQQERKFRIGAEMELEDDGRCL